MEIYYNDYKISIPATRQIKLNELFYSYMWLTNTLYINGVFAEYIGFQKNELGFSTVFALNLISIVSVYIIDKLGISNHSIEVPFFLFMVAPLLELGYCLDVFSRAQDHLLDLMYDFDDSLSDPWREFHISICYAQISLLTKQGIYSMCWATFTHNVFMFLSLLPSFEALITSTYDKITELSSELDHLISPYFY